jgi:hypothetical protein
VCRDKKVVKVTFGLVANYGLSRNIYSEKKRISMSYRHVYICPKSKATRSNHRATIGSIGLALLVMTGCGNLDSEGQKVRLTKSALPLTCARVAELEASHRFCSPSLTRKSKCSKNRMRNEAARLGATHLYFKNSYVGIARGTAFKCPALYSKRNDHRKSASL